MKRLLLIILALAISAGLIYTSYEQARRSAYAEEYSAAIRELEQERYSIEDQLRKLEEDRLRSRTGALGVLIFDEPVEAVYTEAFPVLRELGCTAALALPATFRAGEDGCLTAEQLAALADAGWSICALWDGARALEEDYPALLELFSSLDLEPPMLTLLAAGLLPAEAEGYLNEAGCPAVAFHAPSLELQEGEVLQYLSAIYWDHPSVIAMLDLAAAERMPLALTLDFSTAFGAYDEELFRNMFAAFESAGDAFRFGTLSEALLVHPRSEAYYQARRDYYEAEIARCEREIEAVYQLYSQYSKDLATPQPTK